MIIRFPTGLYADAGQLPVNPADAGNVTYTISNDDPKRLTDITVQLPVAQEIEQRPGPIYNDKTRRAQLGPLIYTYIDAHQTTPGSNRKTFEVGEFLDFNSQAIDLPGQTPVPSIVDIQHNQNLLDLEDAGLTTDEINSLIDLSTTKKKSLEDQIATIQSEINNQKITISENQKQINEVIKIISAVRVVVNIPEGSAQHDPTLDQLLMRLSDLEAARTSLVAELNVLNGQATSTLNDLLSVSELVK
jgi:DNA-binding transcriptional MerR regulator